MNQNLFSIAILIQHVKVGILSGQNYEKETGYAYITYESKHRKQSKYEAAPLMLIHQVVI
jgi:uncharacterized protein HemY